MSTATGALCLLGATLGLRGCRERCPLSLSHAAEARCHTPLSDTSPNGETPRLGSTQPPALSSLPTLSLPLVSADLPAQLLAAGRSMSRL